MGRMSAHYVTPASLGSPPACPCEEVNRTYFVDTERGDNAADGLTEKTALRDTTEARRRIAAAAQIHAERLRLWAASASA